MKKMQSIGAALAGLTVSVVVDAGVVSVSGSGYIETTGQLDNSGGASPFAPRVSLTGFSGLGAFDQTANQQASLNGVTADVSARLQVSASEAGGVTTLSYRETFAGSMLNPDGDVQLVGSPISDIVFTITTQESTLVSWSATDSYILGQVTFQGSGAFVGGPGGDDANGLSLQGFSGLSLDAGTHTFTLDDQKSFGDDFLIDYGFDLSFSNMAVPGPAGVLSLSAIGFIRRRRSRS